MFQNKKIHILQANYYLDIFYFRAFFVYFSIADQLFRKAVSFSQNPKLISVQKGRSVNRLICAFHEPSFATISSFGLYKFP